MKKIIGLVLLWSIERLWSIRQRCMLHTTGVWYLPGPCAPPGTIRPNLNTTALSYSATI